MKNKDLFIVFILLFAFFVSYLVDTISVIRVILGFLFVLFLPGYSLTSLILSSHGYNDIERLIISCGLSLALSPLLSFLVFEFVGHSFILVCLAVFISCISLFAFYKRLKSERTEVSSKSDKIIDKETIDRKVAFIAATSGVLVVVIAFYFKSFPTIGSPLISDILITSLVFILSLLLVIASFAVKTLKETYFILLNCLLFTFVARTIIYLRLSYPPLHDPYCFFIAFLNIYNYHTLNPVQNLYLEGVLHWPLMLLITYDLVLATGLDPIYFFKFQEPILGIFFFLAIFVLAKEITKNDGVALLAGLFSSLASHIIFFQSEYHPQGLIFTFFAFLAYSIIKLLDGKSIMSYSLIALSFVAAIVLTHYFSSLLLAVVFATIFLCTNALAILERKVEGWPFEIVKNPAHNALFLIIVISALAYHLYSYPQHLEKYIKMTFGIPYAYQAEVVAISAPFPSNVIKNVRVLVFILSLISVVYILKTKDKKEFYLAQFWLSFIIFGLIGNYFIWLEVGRITAFYEALTGVFASITLFRFKDEWAKRISKSKRTIVATLIASTIITCSFFGGTYVPAYYFKSFGVNDCYFCSNRLPDMDLYPPAGIWINAHVSGDARYVTDYYGRYGFTGIIVFFWGEKSMEKVSGTVDPIGYMTKSVALNERAYLILNHGYEYQNYKDLVHLCDLIYTNGEIEIHIR